MTVPHRLLNWFSRTNHFATSRQVISASGLKLWLAYHGYNLNGDLNDSGEAWLIAFLSNRWGHKPGLVVDCGANRGDFTRWVLENTQFRVLAIEPSPIRIEELNRLQEKYPERMQVFACGVGAVTEAKTLFEVGADGGGSTFAPEVLEIGYLAEQYQSKIRSEIRLLDDIIDEVAKDSTWKLPIALLKIDVEGLEDDVLKGARRLLGSNPPAAIQFEGNWHQLFRGSTVRSVASLAPDFDLYQLLPGKRGLARREPENWSTNVFAHANWVLMGRRT